MPLINLWKADQPTLMEMTIEQIVSIAGDGRLLDNSTCQKEIREFLLEASTDSLEKYADYCLKNSFNKSGQVLQDVVNELGRRLEFNVVNGRYQGVKNDIGYDGIWADQSDYSLILEVKTTDAYRLSLDTVAGYRDSLIKCEKIDQYSSVLIAVGRTDTGELEAQVRGSKHAWHMRIISIDSLIKLVRVKENADNQETIGKIKTLLTPIEYTRIDGLIDVMFTATKDLESSLETQSDDDVTDKDNGIGVHVNDSTPASVITETREKIITAISKKFRTALVKKTRAMYWSPDHTNRVACTISKRYNSRGVLKYWYAHHPSWSDFLDGGSNSHLALGCVNLDKAFLIPNQIIKDNLQFMNTTVKKDGSGYYWHVKIIEHEEGKYSLQIPIDGKDIALEDFTIYLNE